ncbi:ankyrin repeat domain-containing protein [Vibrio navarrensis]|uniref:ankyrin repeat domain-containing protein n=1 Tax=Vibrio navarrensis TaxID=29495 RepID=UPI001302D796|nr:ankyrin repeat domain-containing protein [Vibrio navarrensis]
MQQKRTWRGAMTSQGFPQYMMLFIWLIMFTLGVLSHGVFAESTGADKPAISHGDSVSEPELSSQEQLALAFFHAARTGDVETMQTFIDAKVNLNFQNGQGYSAMMVAAFRGQKQIVDMLLEANADPCLVDYRGNTALMASIVSGEIDIARALWKMKCDSPHIQQRTEEFVEQFANPEFKKLLKNKLL